MSTRVAAPLQDCTHNINQRLNMKPMSLKSEEPVVLHVRQHNPYDARVVPTDEEATMIMQARAYEHHLVTMMMHAISSPVLSSIISSMATPVQAAPETQVYQPPTPTTDFPAAQSLTKIYREGRPVPTFKSPTKPATPLKGNYIATVAFRRNEIEHFFERAEAFFSSEEEAIGSYVIVDGDRGIDLGRIVSLRTAEGVDADALPPVEIQRVATNDEIERYHAIVEDETKAAATTVSQCNKLGLQKLQVLDATFQFDKQKLTIRYRASERIYFVPLLKALNSLYKCRIWMDKVE